MLVAVHILGRPREPDLDREQDLHIVGVVGKVQPETRARLRDVQVQIAHADVDLLICTDASERSESTGAERDTDGSGSDAHVCVLSKEGSNSGGDDHRCVEAGSSCGHAPAVG